MIKTIAFDADDTLWVNETIFTSTREKIERLLVDYVTEQSLEERLNETEIKNLNLFGYGIKGFILSTIETCIEITNSAVTGETIQQVIDLGKEMLQHPVEILPYVRSTIDILKDQYQLMIITKGDLFDQESKIARSGLADYFDIIEVVSEKEPKVYSGLFQKYNVIPQELLMVGNSLKSDILPLCQIGANAVHIPFHTTWSHEIISHEATNGYHYGVLESMQELPAYIEALQTSKGSARV